ncbi:lytic transglycosylase domain-containing protein [Novosphingobium gossypii]|uniref:lytic transglycosylase domain-containing protein n=1 Tax=Novosphingobium gossypii TaxID=1604774 RepID=UPI003D1D69B7
MVRDIESMRVLALCALFVGMVLPGTARADVMQIGAGGHEWIAGGPVAAVPPISDVPGQVEDAPLEVDAGLHPQSITQALDAAGPTRWRDRVAVLAAKYDISPALLEAVVWQESRWNERAVSPVGARGLAQLMPGTAAQMGVNPADPTANLEGGARYLRMQLDAFGGNIEKALAAYNAGPARVLKAGGIPNIRETKAYVAAIMARLTDPVRQ